MHSSALILAIAAGALAAPLNTRQNGSFDDEANQLSDGSEVGDRGIVAQVLAIPDDILGGNTEGLEPNAMPASTLPKRQFPGLSDAGGAGGVDGVVPEALAIPADLLGGNMASDEVSPGLPGLGKRQSSNDALQQPETEGGIPGLIGTIIGTRQNEDDDGLIGAHIGPLSAKIGRNRVKRQFSNDALEHPQTEGFIPGVLNSVFGTEQNEDDDEPLSDNITRLPGLGKRQSSNDDPESEGVIPGVIDAVFGTDQNEDDDDSLSGNMGSNEVSTGLPGLGKRQFSNDVHPETEGIVPGVFDAVFGTDQNDDDDDSLSGNMGSNEVSPGLPGLNKRQSSNDDPESEGVIPGVIDAFLGTQQNEDDDALTRRQFGNDASGLIENVIEVLENKNPVGPQTIDRNTGIATRQIDNGDQGLVEKVIDVLENKNPVGPQTISGNTGLPPRQVIPGEPGFIEDAIHFLLHNSDNTADRPVVFESIPAGGNVDRQVGQLAERAAAQYDDSFDDSSNDGGNGGLLGLNLQGGGLKRQLQDVKDQGFLNDIENILVGSNEPIDDATQGGSIVGAAGNTGAVRPAFVPMVARQLSLDPAGQQSEDPVSGDGLLDIPEEILKDFTAVPANEAGTDIPTSDDNSATDPIAQSSDGLLRRQVGGSSLAPLADVLEPVQGAVQAKVPAIPGAPVQGVPTLVN